MCPQCVKNRGWECTLHKPNQWKKEKNPKQGLMCSMSWIDRMPWCPNHKHAVEWCSSPGAITSHLSKSHTDALACTIHAYIWSLPGPGLILPPTNTQRRVDRGCKQIIQVKKTVVSRGGFRGPEPKGCVKHTKELGNKIQDNLAFLKFIMAVCSSILYQIPVQHLIFLAYFHHILILSPPLKSQQNTSAFAVMSCCLCVIN